jgi:tetratricopeptide (TPR) repeat protein
MPGDSHSAGPKAQLKYMATLLGVATVMALLVWLLMDTMLLLVAVGAGWFVLGGYALMYFGVINPAGDAIGRILVPSGSSTPPVKPLSHIEAMVARGDYARAAEAYRNEIETDPLDVVSCERLGRLALTELKDPQLALVALREGEKRVAEPKRKLGFALQVAGVYRDHLNDDGRALVELRRVLETYPDVPNAAAIRSEIEELKARRFEGG